MTDRNHDQGRRADIEQLVAVTDETPETIRQRSREVGSTLVPLGLAGPGVAAGDRIGAYVLEERIGSGGAGACPPGASRPSRTPRCREDPTAGAGRTPVSGGAAPGPAGAPAHRGRGARRAARSAPAPRAGVLQGGDAPRPHRSIDRRARASASVRGDGGSPSGARCRPQGRGDSPRHQADERPVRPDGTSQGVRLRHWNGRDGRQRRRLADHPGHRARGHPALHGPGAGGSALPGQAGRPGRPLRAWQARVRHAHRETTAYASPPLDDPRGPRPRLGRVRPEAYRGGSRVPLSDRRDRARGAWAGRGRPRRRRWVGTRPCQKGSPRRRNSWDLERQDHGGSRSNGSTTTSGSRDAGSLQWTVSGRSRRGRPRR